MYVRTYVSTNKQGHYGFAPVKTWVNTKYFDIKWNELHIIKVGFNEYSDFSVVVLSIYSTYICQGVRTTSHTDENKC